MGYQRELFKWLVIKIPSNRMQAYSGGMKPFYGITPEQFYAGALTSFLRIGDFHHAERVAKDISRRSSLDSHFDMDVVISNLGELAQEAARKRTAPLLNMAIAYMDWFMPQEQPTADLYGTILVQTIENGSFESVGQIARSIATRAALDTRFDNLSVIGQLAGLYANNGHMTRAQHQIIVRYLHQLIDQREASRKLSDTMGAHQEEIH